MLKRSVLVRSERLYQCQLARVLRLAVCERGLAVIERGLAVNERGLEHGCLTVNEAPKDGRGRREQIDDLIAISEMGNRGELGLAQNVG